MMSHLKLINTINRKAVQLYNNFSQTVQTKANRMYAIYENYFGIKELKDIQLHVLDAEKVFTEASKARREAQACILKMQEELKRLRQKLDSTNRADENYLNLLTEEHKLIKREFQLAESLRLSEEDEREKFTFFSNRLRESQDFEKIRQEKLKYISLIGSVIGALLGIIATSINHSLRQRDLLNLTKSLERQVDQDKEINFYTIEMKKIVDELEKKLNQSPSYSNSSKLNDKVLRELKSINNRLASIDYPPDGHLTTTADNYKLNILLIGLSVLIGAFFYDSIVK